MLEAAGVDYRAATPEIDESSVKAKLDDPAQIASKLASLKAFSVISGDDWVIGSDSVVSVDGRLFDKPGNRAQAAEHLRFFSGKEMRLTSAVALARSGAVDWCRIETAVLRTRALSEAFIEAYLDAEWPEVSCCVGVFRLEGRGVQLFDRIEGDHF